MNIQDIFNRVIDADLYGGPHSYMCTSLSAAADSGVITPDEYFFAIASIREYLAQVDESTVNGILICQGKPYHNGEAIEIYKDWKNRPFDLTPVQITLEEVLARMETDYTTAHDYGEPGYELDDENQPIILANWNLVESEIIYLLESIDVSTEWSDEWILCNQGLAFRCQPDSYDWEPSYIYTDGGDILTIHDSFDEWEEECANTDYGQPIRPISSTFALEDFDYVKYNNKEYYSGLHKGMDDSPETLLVEVFKKYPNARVLFQTSNSQFYVSFGIYLKVEESN